MEKFRGRLALKVARLTQTFFPESDGRNHGIQQMAHFVPNRCHTPFMEYRTSIEGLAPSTINVRLSAVRKLVSEALHNGLIGVEEAANLSGVPNIPQKGTRLGNWLTREQAKELLAVPDRSKLKGKRDYVILALLIGCALRRQELAALNVETIQLRDGRWVLADFEGKGRRVRTVAVPVWVKQGINAWMTAAGIKEADCYGQSPRKEKSARAWATGRCGRWSSSRRRRLESIGWERTTCAAMPYPGSCRITRFESRRSAFWVPRHAA